MTWTRFMDMHSGGGCKEEPYDKILIEAPEAEARVIFYNRFGHNPERVTCTCCGEDYSIGEHETLAEATAYDRDCDSAYFDEDGQEWGEDICEWDRERRVRVSPEGKEVAHRYVERPSTRYVKYGGRVRPLLTVEEYVALPNVLVVRADEITDAERVGSVPDAGYVWVGD